MNHEKGWKYGIGKGVFKERGAIYKFFKIAIFTFLVEITFLLRLGHMFEHNFFFFLHSSIEESDSK